jgi:hypothetical protein
MALRTAIDSLSAAEADLTTSTLAWCDRWWDGERALPWAPDGHEAVSSPRLLHLVPGSAWYAFGLLLRDGPGDRDRARQVLHALCDLQYDRPGTDWHGTFAIFAESPTPPLDGPRMWDDYDPNWRQFLGTTFLAVLAAFESRLEPALVGRLDRALRLAVESEPPHRVPPSYSNIALMKAALEVGAGTRFGEDAWVQRGERLAVAVVEGYDRHGAFEEYNSPTYYGVDLFALAHWRALSPSALLRDEGQRLEAALWRDTARWWHAGLGNLCGPYTRTYGMDLHAYVGKLVLWSWAALGRPAAPLPRFDAPFDGTARGTAGDRAVHGHDLFAGAITAALGAELPSDATASFLTAPTTEHTVEQVISRPTRPGTSVPERIATGWLAPELMFGAERCDADLSWWDQYVAATAHWRAPDGGIGWLTVRMPGPSSAQVEPGTLEVPRLATGTEPAIVTVAAPGLDVDGLDRHELTAGRWTLPGLDLRVDGARAVDVVGAGPPSWGPSIQIAVDTVDGLTLSPG